MSDVTRRINLVAGDASAVNLISRTNTLLTQQTTGLEQLASIYARDTQRFEVMLRRRVAGHNEEAAAVERLRDAQLRADRQRISFEGVGDAGRSADIGKTSGAAERLLRSTGVGAGAEAFGLIGDLADMREAFKESGGSVKGFISTIGPLGLAGLAATSLGLAFEALNAVMAESERRLQNNIADLKDRLKVELDAEIESRRALQSGGSTALTKMRDEAQAELELLRSSMSDFASMLNDMSLTDSMRGAYAQALDESTQKVEVLTEQIQQYNFVLDSQLAVQADARIAGQKAVDALRSSLVGGAQSLTGSLSAAAESVRDFSQRYMADLAKTLREASAAADVLRQSEESLTGAYIDGQAQRMEARQLVEAREQEMLDRQLMLQAADHAKQLIDIETAGNATIASLIEQRAEAEQDFAYESLRAQQQYLRDRQRLDEDAQTDILSAIREGDFSQAREIEQQRNTDRQRQEEDFNAQQALRQQENEEFKAGVELRIQAERDAVAVSLALAQQEYEQRLALDAEERAIRERYAEEDRARYEADITARYQTQKKALDDLLLAELARIESTKTALQLATEGIMQSVIASLAQTAKSLFSGFNMFAPIAQAVLPFIPSFATGSRFIERDMIAQLHAGERVLTAEENRRSMASPAGVNGLSSPMANGLSGGAHFGLQLSTAGMFSGAAIGDVVSSAELDATVAHAQNEIGIALRELFAQLKRGGRS